MRHETQLALTIILCAALIGSAVMLRDATMTGNAIAETQLHESELGLEIALAQEPSDTPAIITTQAVANAPSIESPTAPLVPKSLTYGPSIRPCAALALGIDALLIVAALLALFALLQRARGRNARTAQLTLDIALILALIPLLAQRGACAELLPLQYASFIVLALGSVFAHIAYQLKSRQGVVAGLPRAPQLQKPAPVTQLPVPKNEPIAVPAPPAPPKKHVILFGKPEPVAITRLRTGPSIWQRLATIARGAPASKPALPQVPSVKALKGITGRPAQLPKKLQHALDTTFRKAKVTDIPDLRSELGAIASSEDLLRAFNKSVRKMQGGKK